MKSVESASPPDVPLAAEHSIGAIAVHRLLWQTRRLKFTAARTMIAMQAISPLTAKRWSIESLPTQQEVTGHTAGLFASAAAQTAALCRNEGFAIGLMLSLNRRSIPPDLGFAFDGVDGTADTAMSTTPPDGWRQAAPLTCNACNSHRRTAAKPSPSSPW